MNYWLMKSEPSVYSIMDLKKDDVTCWDGVRNYQARNFMRDKMKKGDRILFYHSNSNPSGVAGIAEVLQEAYPDFTSWDKKDKHYDPKSTKEKPVWMMVDLKFIQVFNQLVSLKTIKDDKRFQDMMVIQKGSRLSVQPVSKKHFDYIVRLGNSKK